ncbi:MAG TPA: cell division protein ZapA [Thermohalobaculum sp.]|nr:cell division protein ZapA [Thermohalobaculum sp.]
MPEISVDVAGRNYRLICGPGEEQHLTGLAHLIDAEANALSRGRQPMANDRLMLMSALMVADRLYEAEKRIEELEAELAQAGGGGGAREAELAERLSALAQRAEALAAGARDGNGRARR